MTSIPPDTIGGRLRRLLAERGMSIRDFSEKSRVPYRTLQDYLGDKCKPGADHLARFAADFDVHYILTGESRLLRPKQPALSNREQELLRNIERRGMVYIPFLGQDGLLAMRDLMLRVPTLVWADGVTLVAAQTDEATPRAVTS